MAQFYSLAKLDFSIHGTSENQAAKIYANSRNMVEVIITVEMTDKDGKKIDFNDGGNTMNHPDTGVPIFWHFFKHSPLYICHSETGEKLGSPWVTSGYPTEYVNGTSTAPPPDSSSIYFRQYISCDKHDLGEITEKISVGIDVPGVGKFDTSRNGTSTMMPSGSVFKSPKSYDLTALPPIDYGNQSNIKIEYGGFETIDNGIKWTQFRDVPTSFSGYLAYTEGRYSCYEAYWNGEVRRRIVYIKPNLETTGVDTFKKHDVLYNPLRNGDVSTGAVGNDAGFSVINEETDRPSAVTSYGRDRDAYEVNLWYSRKNHLTINGKFLLADGHWWYMFNEPGKAIDEDHRGDDESGAATLLLYKLVMPVSANGKFQEFWKDTVRPMTVNVIDVCGNEGSFQLTFNGDTYDKFDEPQLV